jgi:uncharacterized protein
MYYLDTSALIAGFAREPTADRVFDWLAENSIAGLAISPWVLTEFSSALSIKLRRGDLPFAERDGALADFQSFIAGNVTVWPLETRHFRQATDLCNRQGLSLRAGDALHLALVMDRQSALFTSDQVLTAAARSLGVVTDVP